MIRHPYGQPALPLKCVAKCFVRRYAAGKIQWFNR